MPIKSTSTSSEVLAIGGDFAGYVGKFSPSNGAVIPLPAYMVPQELVEWGQEPSILEILVSEELSSTDDFILKRQTISVLPAIGCGVDNLESTRSEQVFPRGKTIVWNDVPSIRTNDAVMDDKDTVHTLELETLFGLPDAHRIRVSLTMTIDNTKDSSSHRLESPIRVQLERQSSATSSQGTRTDGGGLDGRTVSTLIGESLKKELKFAERPPLTKGTWKSTTTTTTIGDSDDAALQAIHLPGNVTITNCKNEEKWSLQVSHFVADSESDNPLTGSLRIVQRTFPGGGAAVEWTTTYSEETGEFVA